MKRFALVAAFACLAGAAAAQPLMTPDQYDPLHYLPPPPAASSPRAQADLDELHYLQATSTPADLASAKFDNDNQNAVVFGSVLGPAWDLTRLPATARLVADVMTAEKIAATAAKNDFHRDRPWIVDPAIKTCAAPVAGQGTDSYPSGHTTLAFTLAVVLAAEMPDHAQDLLERARKVGESRLVCGFHFRSDIAAGEAFGTVIGARLLAAPGLRSELDAAAAELRAAGLTR